MSGWHYPMRSFSTLLMLLLMVGKTQGNRSECPDVNGEDAVPDGEWPGLRLAAQIDGLNTVNVHPSR